MSDETNVLYKVLADFSNLSKAKTQAKKDIRELRQAESAANRASLSEHKNLARQVRETAKAYTEESKGLKASTTSYKGYVQQVRAAKDAHVALNRGLRTSVNLYGQLGTSATNARGKLRQLRTEQEKLNRAMGASNQGTKQFDDVIRRLDEQSLALGRVEKQNQETLSSVKGLDLAYNDLSKSVSRNTDSARRNNEEYGRAPRFMSKTQAQVWRLGKDLNNLSKWRPRLIPPFIALIPILGAVLGLINPLIAGLGGVSVAVFGFASSLASLSGVVLSVVPGLASILSLVAALKIAFGGIGSVFQKYQALRDAAGTGAVGGAGPQQAELTHTEELERAQIRYSRALEDVRFAQEDLNEAREDYLDNIRELKKELDDLEQAEGKAKTNALLASEYYAQIANDPTVDQEDKVAAKEYADELASQAEDASEARKETEDELNTAQAGGVENDRDVIMAKRQVADAEWAVRDAQLALIDTQNGVGASAGVAASASNDFQAALDALSPSARSVVLSILAMEEAWNDLKGVVQESFFSEIIDDVELLRKLIDPLKTLLSGVAGAAGRVTSDLINQVTGSDWTSDIEGPITDTSVGLVESYGEALGNILEALKDIAVAAGPFAQDLANSFVKATESLEKLVGTARDDGSMAKWLDTVYTRLQSWWQIVKDIGKTLFNYGAAAADFGDNYLTKGFQDVVKGWREASEAAREEGSTFRTFLEDIKPLLSEVSALFADFFRWIGKVATDKDNLAKFTDIINRVRTEMGPALSRILDILAKSNISDSLITALVTILDTIGDFLDSGGAEGFEAFFTAANELIGTFNSLLNDLPDEVIKGLASSLAVISALTFFGLDNVLFTISRVLGSKAIASVIKDLKTLGTGGVIAGALGGKGGAAGPGVASRGLVGGVAGLALGAGGALVSDGQEGGRDIAGAALSGAGTGAFIGSFIPFLGPLIGAAVGAAVSASFEHDRQYRSSGQAARDSQVRGDLAKDISTASNPTAKASERKTAQDNLASSDPNDYAIAAAQYSITSQPNYSTAVDDVAKMQAGPDLPKINDNLSIGAVRATEAAERHRELTEAFEQEQEVLISLNRVHDIYQLALDNASKEAATRAQLTVIQRESERRTEQEKLEFSTLLLQAEKELNDQGKVSEETQLALDRSYEDVALSIYNQAQATADATGKSTDYDKVIRDNAGSLKELEGKAEGAGIKIQGVTDNLLEIPEMVEISIKTVGAEKAIQYWKDIKTLIEDTDKALGEYGARHYSLNGVGTGITSNTGGPVYRRNAGGGIPGQVPGTGVTDSVPALLTPGEFIMRRAAVSKYGPNLLSRMNAGAAQISEMSRPGYGLSHHSTGGGIGALGASSVVNSGRSIVFENVNIHNPVGKTSEESISDLHDEISFMYGY